MTWRPKTNSMAKREKLRIEAVLPLENMTGGSERANVKKSWKSLDAGFVVACHSLTAIQYFACLTLRRMLCGGDRRAQ